MEYICSQHVYEWSWCVFLSVFVIGNFFLPYTSSREKDKFVGYNYAIYTNAVSTLPCMWTHTFVAITIWYDIRNDINAFLILFVFFTLYVLIRQYSKYINYFLSFITHIFIHFVCFSSFVHSLLIHHHFISCWCIAFFSLRFPFFANFFIPFDLQWREFWKKVQHKKKG